MIMIVDKEDKDAHGSIIMRCMRNSCHQQQLTTNNLFELFQFKLQIGREVVACKPGGPQIHVNMNPLRCGSLCASI